MRETLYTIPVWDGFGSGEGCPLCRIYQILEKQALSGILGPAMMEPSIREETNRLGFCPRHMGMLARQEGKLPFEYETDFEDTGAVSSAAGQG